jgi:hypothetical protein
MEFHRVQVATHLKAQKGASCAFFVVGQDNFGCEILLSYFGNKLSLLKSGIA